MAKDLLSLHEALAAPNSFAAGVRLAEELNRIRLRSVAARIVAALVDTDAATSQTSLMALVEELRNDKVSVVDIDIEVIGPSSNESTGS